MEERSLEGERWTMKDNDHELERNIAAFNAETDLHGGYVYTTVDRWSSRYATNRQTDELIRMLFENYSPSIRIVDIGCGDGTFTQEIADRFRPSAIRGIDPAANAVRAAGQQFAQGPSSIVSFETGDIYSVEARGEDIAIVRGVLHHLDRPKEAIAQLGRQFSAVIALEPNGYNPAMKIIEKTSSYHRQHDEKSYWPPLLDRWFEEVGLSVVAQKYFCLVPYFCPTAAAKLLSFLEPVVETVPVVRHVACGTKLVLYRRRP
jgi:SAM-dependent methyltransferase